MAEQVLQCERLAPELCLSLGVGAAGDAVTLPEVRDAQLEVPGRRLGGEEEEVLPGSVPGDRGLFGAGEGSRRVNGQRCPLEEQGSGGLEHHAGGEPAREGNMAGPSGPASS